MNAMNQGDSKCGEKKSQGAFNPAGIIVEEKNVRKKGNTYFAACLSRTKRPRC
jgi:hypothetical protein